MCRKGYLQYCVDTKHVMGLEILLLLMDEWEHTCVICFEEYKISLAGANDEHVLLIQDNNRIHAAAVMQQWFGEHQGVIWIQ